ncbi:MAG: Calx-beta domain-containing protein [Chitinophagales bacterium]
MTYSAAIREVIVSPEAGNSLAGVSGFSSAQPYAMESGSLIGPSISFQPASIQYMEIYWGVIDYPAPGSTFEYLTEGYWPGATDKYLGLRFSVGADEFYGWARLDCGPDHHSFTIKDYAYNATPNEAIVIGGGAAPIPDVAFNTAAFEVEENIGLLVAVTVIVSEPVGAMVAVDLNAIGTTATEGVDFIFTDPSPIIFSAAGPVSQTFTIEIIDDLIVDPDENIALEIIAVSPGVEIGTPAIVTILINDNEVPLPSEIFFTTSTITYDETDGIIAGVVNISESSDCSVDVISNAGAGTATEGVDFNFTSPETLNFISGGATSLDFNIELIDDIAVEPDETIQFELTNPIGCAIAGEDVLTVNIISDDQVDINDLADHGIKVYSSGHMLHIKFENNDWNNTNLSVFDSEGKLVFSNAIIALENEFDLQFLPPGIYLVHLNSNGQLFKAPVYFSE